MDIEHVKNQHAICGNNSGSAGAFGIETARAAAAWHATFPEYEPTPLVQLDSLARDLGVGGFYVKDESKRFGLNAFKVLGGSYAMGKCIADILGMSLDDLPYGVLMGEEVRRKLRQAAGDLTFVTATDGNHGRGVAWTAAQLGLNAVVIMPRNSSLERLDNIRKLGARASFVDANYDEAVRLAAAWAREHGWLVVQDTSWDGYEEVPRWIMEGYTTLALEAVEQLGDARPTHVFLQAGVGSMAGAVAGFLADYYGEDMPVISIVEPTAADCVFRTAQADDGRLHAVTGDLSSIMAGLSCGEPCPLGWDVLAQHARHFFSIADWVSAEGMRILAHPLAGDAPIESGESGACTTGLAAELMRNPAYAALRDDLGLGRDSVVLCISTDGATDRANYNRIVNEGAYPRA